MITTLLSTVSPSTVKFPLITSLPQISNKELLLILLPTVKLPPIISLPTTTKLLPLTDVPTFKTLLTVASLIEAFLILALNPLITTLFNTVSPSTVKFPLITSLPQIFNKELLLIPSPTIKLLSTNKSP